VQSRDAPLVGSGDCMLVATFGLAKGQGRGFVQEAAWSCCDAAALDALMVGSGDCVLVPMVGLARRHGREFVSSGRHAYEQSRERKSGVKTGQSRR
jgi:hypothetical protein